MRKACIAAVAANALLVSGALAQELPPADRVPREPDAWAADMARRDARPPDFPVAFPEYRPAFEALQARLRSLTNTYTDPSRPYDMALATQLIGELYVDVGHPILNSTAQDYIIDMIIGEVARWPEDLLPDDARQALADGMLQYVRRGGGQYWPFMQARLATVLDRLAPENTAVQGVVENLLNDALGWANAVGNDVERNWANSEGERHWGDVFWLKAYDAEVQPVLRSSSHPAQYDKAVAALAAVLTASMVDVRGFMQTLKAATDEALRDFHDDSLTEDLTCRLLIVYRRLLARRPMLAERVAVYLDNQLARLAYRPGRLKTDRHWRLWTDAVLELRPERASRRMRGYIAGMAREKDLPAARQQAAARLRAFVE